MTRRLNTHYRTREHLTLDEVTELIHAASTRGRHQHRDSVLLLMMFRHGLRATEAAQLKWDAIMWKEQSIWINRVKNSESGMHFLPPDEIEALTELKRLYPNTLYIFPTESGNAMSVDSIERIVTEAGKLARLGKVHPHQLRHSCGFHLANQGATTRDIQDYLGHKNIQHTVRYTKLNPNRFKAFQW
ncbi:tyrosine-type recombinase/integrase [Tolypothrix campylonemoides VB511288]|nr:tyrosine-type recombinase/integrase [Tolypothrix campylonemoides VB511288]